MNERVGHTIEQGQNAVTTSHVWFTTPMNTLVPKTAVIWYLAQWSPWIRFVRTPVKLVLNCFIN